MNYKRVTYFITGVLIFAMVFSLIPMMKLNASAFSDVSDGVWYSDAVEYVTTNGLFNGVTVDQFQPNTTMTRGMFVTVLGRYAGIAPSGAGTGVITKTEVNMRRGPSTDSGVVAVLDKGTAVTISGMSGDWYMVSVNGLSGYVRSDLMSAKCCAFDDVAYGSYYGSYVHWAYTAGVVSGTSTERFSPDTGINREQLCKILYSYLGYKGLKLNTNSNTYAFPDQAAISSWAVDAVNYMHCAGVVGGRDNGNFDPQATATRAEVAVMMMRFNAAIVSPEPSEPDEDNPDEEEKEYDETPYDGYIPFGNVVPESAAVSDSYFDDALFIGHSIINGMSQSHLNLFPNSGFFAVNGGTTVGLLEDSYPYIGVTVDDNGNRTVEETEGTLEDVLEGYEYKKVYIMLGINEIGAQKRLCDNISTMIDMIRSELGNVKIYVISVTPLDKEYTTYSEYFKRVNLVACNSALMQMCITENVYYLDMYSSFAGEDGYIKAEYTRDGVHFSTAGYKLFVNYIKTHAM